MKIILTGLTVCFFSTNGLAGENIIKMSTTTSTQASGLLDVLLPELERDTGIQVKVIAKGTGAAIRDGSGCDFRSRQSARREICSERLWNPALCGHA
jgi:ABC-type tungstate transport system permease subunit